MRRVILSALSDRPCRLPPAGVLAPVRSPGRPGGAGVPPRGREPLYERRKASDRAAGPAAGPGHRPGRRAAQLHPELRALVGLSENERLHPELDRRHRRQGEEGRCARQPLRARAGRGPRYEEGDGRARPGADRAGQGGREGGHGRRRGGRGAARGGPGGTRRLPGRGRALGLGDQAARQRAQEGRGQSPGCPPDHQSVEGVRRDAGHGGGDRPEGRRRAALPAGRAIQGQGRRQGRRSRPESGRERGEAAPGLGGLPRTARAV